MAGRVTHRGERIVCLMDVVDAFRRSRRMTKREAGPVANLHINTITRYFALMQIRGWIRPVATAQPDGPKRSPRGLKPTVWEWVA